MYQWEWALILTTHPKPLPRSGALGPLSLASQPLVTILELRRNPRVSHKQHRKSMVLQITEITEFCPVPCSPTPPFKTQYLRICSDMHEIRAVFLSMI